MARFASANGISQAHCNVRSPASVTYVRIHANRFHVIELQHGGTGLLRPLAWFGLALCCARVRHGRFPLLCADAGPGASPGLLRSESGAHAEQLRENAAQSKSEGISLKRINLSIASGDLLVQPASQNLKAQLQIRCTAGDVVLIAPPVPCVADASGQGWSHGRAQLGRVSGGGPCATQAASEPACKMEPSTACDQSGCV